MINAKKTGKHLKFVYLVKLISNRHATLSSEKLENQATLRARACPSCL